MDAVSAKPASFNVKIQALAVLLAAFCGTVRVIAVELPYAERAGVVGKLDTLRSFVL